MHLSIESVSAEEKDKCAHSRALEIHEPMVSPGEGLSAGFGGSADRWLMRSRCGMPSSTSTWASTWWLPL